MNSDILTTEYNALLKEVTDKENDGPVVGQNSYVVNRLFVAGFDKQTTERELRVFFSDLGRVKTVNIISDKIERPYGFVTFKDKTDCIKILLRKDEFQFHIRGKTLKINPAWYKPARTCNSNYHFNNILSPNSCGGQEMHKVINSNGDVVMCTTLNGTTFFREIPQSLPPILPKQLHSSNMVNGDNPPYVPISYKGIRKITSAPIPINDLDVSGIRKLPQPDCLSPLPAPLYQHQVANGKAIYTYSDQRCIALPYPLLRTNCIDMNYSMVHVQPVVNVTSDIVF